MRKGKRSIESIVNAPSRNPNDGYGIYNFAKDGQLGNRNEIAESVDMLSRFLNEEFPTAQEAADAISNFLDQVAINLDEFNNKGKIKNG